MSNRAYLYSVNSIPTSDSVPDVIKGLSEYEYDIPIVYKILLGNEPEVCRSVIWRNEKAGLVADFRKGLNDLLLFLELFKKEEMDDPEMFEELYEETLKFLKNPKHTEKYVLLEVSEIFDMEEEPLDVLFKDLIFDIKFVANEAKSLVKLSANPKNPNVFFTSKLGEFHDLKKDWDETLGIDCWSNILYYHFPKKTKSKR
jgi:hypothetical protein